MSESSCCRTEKDFSSAGIQIKPFASRQSDDEVCCGGPAGSPGSPHEKPGYQIARFVERFMELDGSLIPTIKTNLSWWDIAGTIMVRLGFNRNHYKVSPGLYGVGSPTPDSPVLVTANYKLSFDAVRKALFGMNAWLLVLDTCGINVWCAAGKGSFGTAELVGLVKSTGLSKHVNHRRFIVPQFGATGVAAHQVKKQCGFTVVWGPVRAADIRDFLHHDMQASAVMRRVTFTLPERLVLIPVEMYISLKPVLLTGLVIFILSGIGPDIFSFQNAWERGLNGVISLIGGVFAGAFLTPVFLQKLPGRAFAIKGAAAGIMTAFVMALLIWMDMSWLAISGLILLTVSVSSYLAMNFTGATPFTSPTGVEKEMTKSIPLQIMAIIIAAIFWIGDGFIGNHTF